VTAEADSFVVPRGRPFTVADLAATPYDGNDAFEALRPFPVRVVPRQLLGRLAR